MSVLEFIMLKCSIIFVPDIHVECTDIINCLLLSVLVLGSWLTCLCILRVFFVHFFLYFIFFILCVRFKNNNNDNNNLDNSVCVSAALVSAAKVMCCIQCSLVFTKCWHYIIEMWIQFPNGRRDVYFTKIIREDSFHFYARPRTTNV